MEAIESGMKRSTTSQWCSVWLGSLAQHAGDIVVRGTLGGGLRMRWSMSRPMRNTGGVDMDGAEGSPWCRDGGTEREQRWIAVVDGEG